MKSKNFLLMKSSVDSTNFSQPMELPCTQTDPQQFTVDLDWMQSTAMCPLLAEMFQNHIGQAQCVTGAAAGRAPESVHRGCFLSMMVTLSSIVSRFEIVSLKLTPGMRQTPLDALKLDAALTGVARTVYGDHVPYLTYVTSYFETGDGAKRDADGCPWIALVSAVFVILLVYKWNAAAVNPDGAVSGRLAHSRRPRRTSTR